jgi:hypothetical protein
MPPSEGRIVGAPVLLRQPLRRMADAARRHPLALLIDDHGVVMVVGPVDAGVPHASPFPGTKAS